MQTQTETRRFESREADLFGDEITAGLGGVADGGSVPSVKWRCVFLR